jgi:hypothetical protein
MRLIIWSYISTYGSTALVDFGCFFSFLIYTQSVGLLGRGVSPSEGRYLHTEQHKNRINANRHPYLEWDSNPWSQRSSGRIRCMTLTARPLWSASLNTPEANKILVVQSIRKLCRVFISSWCCLASVIFHSRSEDFRKRRWVYRVEQNNVGIASPTGTQYSTAGSYVWATPVSISYKINERVHELWIIRGTSLAGCSWASFSTV